MTEPMKANIPQSSPAESDSPREDSTRLIVSSSVTQKSSNVANVSVFKSSVDDTLQGREMENDIPEKCEETVVTKENENLASRDQVSDNAKSNRCFVRCLRRLSCVTANRHVILESGKSYWIGRADDNQVCIPDVVLSRKQAEIKEISANEWTVVDNKSLNGTRINGQLLSPMTPHLLHDRDILQLGPDDIQEEKGYQFMFHRALKFRWHPDIPELAVVDTQGRPNALKRCGLNANDVPMKRFRFEESNSSKLNEQLVGLNVQMRDMEERLERKEEEKERVKKETERKMEQKLIEEEAVLRNRLNVETKRQWEQLEHQLQQEMSSKAAAHDQNIRSIFDTFAEEKKLLEEQLRSAIKKQQITKEEMDKNLKTKENQLANELKAASKKLAEEKARLELELGQELKWRQAEEQKKITEEMNEQRRSFEEKKKLLEQQLQTKTADMDLQLAYQKVVFEKEREKLRADLQKSLAEELRAKEEKIKEDLESQKRRLEEEKKKIEASLQEEMNKKLEEQDARLEEELRKQKTHLDQEIEKREAKEARLAGELERLKSSEVDDELDSRRLVLNQLEETMEQELQCAVCTELFIEATALNCSHAFCSYCIKEWRKNKNECPICRQRITTETRALVLDSYIDRMVEHLGDEMKERRKTNVEFREQQKKDRLKQPALADPSTSWQIPDETDESDDDDRDSDSSSSLSGDPDAYYGGYGSCYICGRRGHWANGCRDRYYY